MPALLALKNGMLRSAWPSVTLSAPAGLMDAITSKGWPVSMPPTRLGP